MFKAIKEFFLGKPVEATQPEAAPYKVETPFPVTKVEAVNAQPIAEVAPAKAKKAPAKKPAAPKAKAPAKPKAPAKAKAPAKKAPAKKPAKKAQ
jgi:hypothetical protein